MSGRVIDLATRRVLEPGKPEPVARLPLVVRSERDAVALTLPGTEWWLTPGQARELARDLWLGADAATGSPEGPRPRGA